MFYDRFAKLCKSKGVSDNKACIAIGVNRSAVAKWKQGGTPNGTTLSKMADYFGVTVDYLLNGEQNEKPAAKSDGLTSKDKRDIARDLEKIMAEIESTETVMFDGDPATDAAKETLRNAIAMGLEYAKKVNKETYTPKKYRKEE